MFLAPLSGTPAATTSLVLFGSLELAMVWGLARELVVGTALLWLERRCDRGTVTPVPAV